jgi:acetyl esterase/lipase
MSVDDSYPAPSFDRELGDLLTSRGVPPTMVLEQMIQNRSIPAVPGIDEVIADRKILREDRTIASLDGDFDITLSIFKKSTHTPGGPGVYYVHGGGMVGGDRFAGVDRALEWVDLFDAVVVSAEYRLAPEHPDPAPVNDCYAGLSWTVAHAADLNVDDTRIIIVGGSSGGGLAAGATLMSRDRGDAPLAAQILIGPMLDDRNETFSSHQIDGIGVWDRASNEIGWGALLGARRGTDDVSSYAAPGRATDLSGLPPTYIDCGSAEVFRDEDVAYANAIWAAGGSAELHVWSGGHHGFDTIFPSAMLSLLARRTRADFVKRVLGFS